MRMCSISIWRRPGYLVRLRHVDVYWRRVLAWRQSNALCPARSRPDERGRRRAPHVEALDYIAVRPGAALGCLRGSQGRPECQRECNQQVQDEFHEAYCRPIRLTTSLTCAKHLKDSSIPLQLFFEVAWSRRGTARSATGRTPAHWVHWYYAGFKMQNQ